MSETFAFHGRTRVIARAVVETMVPRWPGFDPDLTEVVLARVEAAVDTQPRAVQFMILAGLWGLEVSGPVFGHGLRPLSSVDRDERDRRLTSIGHHPLALFRQGVLLYRTLVNLCAYSLPEVEEFLGAHRQAWRADRVRLREALLKIDEGRAMPPTPEALSSPDILPSAEFLQFGAAERLGHTAAEEPKGTPRRPSRRRAAEPGPTSRTGAARRKGA